MNTEDVREIVQKEIARLIDLGIIFAYKDGETGEIMIEHKLEPPRESRGPLRSMWDDPE